MPRTISSRLERLEKLNAPDGPADRAAWAALLRLVAERGLPLVRIGKGEEVDGYGAALN